LGGGKGKPVKKKKGNQCLRIIQGKTPLLNLVREGRALKGFRKLISGKYLEEVSELQLEMSREVGGSNVMRPNPARSLRNGGVPEENKLENSPLTSLNTEGGEGERLKKQEPLERI